MASTVRPIGRLMRPRLLNIARRKHTLQLLRRPDRPQLISTSCLRADDNKSKARAFSTFHAARKDQEVFDDDADDLLGEDEDPSTSSQIPSLESNPELQELFNSEDLSPEQSQELEEFIQDGRSLRRSKPDSRPLGDATRTFRKDLQHAAQYSGGSGEIQDVPAAPGFFSDGEETEDPGDDPEWNADDISEMAHGELEQHRELREFARVVGWDMPLLWQYRKPFQPPTAATPLRFRYTSFMGESHPAAPKVVCDFTPSALPDLSPAQVTKLIKLLGPRYTPPPIDRAKLSSQRFPTRAQNKRYITDTLSRLVAECKNGEDLFEDVPLDFRHDANRLKNERRKGKFRNCKFPEQWKITEERSRELRKFWAKGEPNPALEEGLRQGLIAGLVDGSRAIQGKVEEDGRRSEITKEREPAMAGGRKMGQRQRT